MSDSVAQWRIGEAARRSGVSAVNIRYYEKESLLKAHGRSASSYRLYSDSDIHQLRFIRLCRAMDMSLDEVRSLLSLDLRSKADCDAACTTIDAHLHHVRERLQELQALERSLLDLRNGCDGTGAHCRIIEALHAQADAQPSGESPRPGGPLRHV